MIVMNLGVFRDALRRVATSGLLAERLIVFDFAMISPTTIASYRGFYEQAALGFSEDGSVTVRGLLSEVESAIGKKFTGWKGGDYLFDEGTDLWVANQGRTSNTRILDLADYDDSWFVIRTALL